MKAAVFYGPRSIKLEEVETPEINEEELLIKVEKSAICGTDVRIYEGNKTKDVRTPSIIGHELVGSVEKVGADVLNFSIGDRVGVIPVIPCRKCYYCMRGRENVCLNREAIGYEHDGGFAEYVRIPKKALEAGNIVRLSKDLSYQEAVIMEPLACCINGQRKAGVTMGDVVVVVGGGPIGLMHVQLAKIGGAKTVILSEPIEHRREKARKVGADLTIDPNHESLEEEVFKKSEDLGADVVIMAIGVPQVVAASAKLLKKGGTLNLFAGFTKGIFSEIDPNIVHYNELIINGTSALTRADYMQAVNLVEAKRINTDVLVTPGYNLENIEEAIHAVRDGRGMKSVLDHN